FFSSRRRHTRFSRDWSSDVCSSDLAKKFAITVVALPGHYVGDFRGKQRLNTAQQENGNGGHDEAAHIREGRDGKAQLGQRRRDKIGRASCRERGEATGVAE